MAANALSRCHDEGSAAAITTVISEWCQEVIDNYEEDEHVKKILNRLAVEPKNVEGYALVEGMLRYNGRIVIGDSKGLKKKILQSLHESTLGGHSEIHNSYLRVKQLFHWPRLKAKVKEFVLICDTCKHCSKMYQALVGHQTGV